jgi:hypothetical protein
VVQETNDASGNELVKEQPKEEGRNKQADLSGRPNQPL